MNESELIIRESGGIYHLDLRPDEICDTILTVGDPQRVARVSKHFDQIHFQREHREIITHRGRVGNCELMVMSTGMGTDNIEIVMNELDALVNVDFDNRKVKEERQRLRIIRIGTSGSISTDIPVGSIVASASGMGMDTLLEFYSNPASPAECAIAEEFRTHMNFSFTPYLISANAVLMETMGGGCLKGNTLTCPGFYVPQGRQLRAASVRENYLSRLRSFRSGEFTFGNLEMETSAYYAFGRIFGHQVLSLNAILANRITGEFVSDHIGLERELIEYTLERIEDL